MSKRFIILLVCVFAIVAANAQSAVRADELFAAQEYNEAMTQYGRLLSIHPQNTLYQYRYARCLQELGKTEEAISWFEVAGEKYALRNFYLAKLYAETYRFDNAVSTMEKYVESIDETNERYEEAMMLVAYAKKGARYIRRVDDICLIDSIIVEKNRFLEAYHLSEESGKLSLDDGSATYTSAREDRKIIERDGKLLTCQRLLDDWSACDTLPEPINGEYNTGYPFMMSDGVTMFFASENKDGLGGYDIYQTRYNNQTNSWLTPENIGFPFNSFANDYMYAVDEQQGVGWFATDRRTGKDSVAIYKFALNENKQVLRDTTEEYIRRAAQLLDYRKREDTVVATNEKIVDEKTTDKDNQQETDEIEIVINDSLVYTSTDDFISDEAKKLAVEYVQLLQQIQEEEQSLKEQRVRYSQTDAEQRKDLYSVILTQEKTLQTMRKECKEIRKKLLAEENSALMKQ